MNETGESVRTPGQASGGSEAVEVFIERWRDTGGKERIGCRQGSARRLAGRPGATTPWPEKPEAQAEAEEELLQRLVDLNHQRAAEEAQGKIRWLRPEYQAPEETAQQTELETAGPENKPTSQPANQSTKKLTWPKTLQEQIRAVRDQLETVPMDPDTLASHYKRKPEKSVTQVLDALTELGMVKPNDNGQFRLREN